MHRSYRQLIYYTEDFAIFSRIIYVRSELCCINLQLSLQTVNSVSPKANPLFSSLNFIVIYSDIIKPTKWETHKVVCIRNKLSVCILQLLYFRYRTKFVINFGFILLCQAVLEQSTLILIFQFSFSFILIQKTETRRSNITDVRSKVSVHLH